MDWYRRLDNMTELSLDDGHIYNFVSQDQARKEIKAYNNAFNHMLHKNYDRAESILEKLAKEDKTFSEARYLLGILRCIEDRYESAEKLFNQALITSEDPNLAADIEDALDDIEDILEGIRAQQESRERSEELLEAIINSQSERKLLEFVGDGQGTYTMAGKERAHAIKDGKVISNARYVDPLYFSEDKKKTRRFFAVVAALAIGILVLFFAFVRPGIKNAQQLDRVRADKLAWLEENMRERAAESSDIYEMLLDYNAFIDHYFGNED